MMKKYIFLIVLLFSISNCSNLAQIENNLNDYKHNLDKAVENTLADYIGSHMEYESFTLIIAEKSNLLSSITNYLYPLYIVGPSMKEMFCHGEGSFAHYPSSFMRIKDKIVFIQSVRDHHVRNDKKLSKFFNKYSYSSKSGINGAWNHYLRHAIAFSINEDSHILQFYTNEPDSLFKKNVEFCAPKLD